MFIYNTLTNKKEEVIKPAKGPFKVFVCGPTVYDYIHIGNARTYTSFDILVRYLRWRGWNVFYLQNITDVDNKIIRRAAKENVSPLALAKKLEKNYHEDEKALNVSSVTKYARATDHIPQIISQILTLIKKGYAYKTDDGYYFDISKFKSYGRLSGRTLGQAEDSISRIDEGVNKKNKADFSLWKFPHTPVKEEQAKAGTKKYKIKIVNSEPLWLTPIGWGRPGWHIEDTAITEHHFGVQYDLHGGGIDLKFPHHEAEIAQQEAASGKSPLAMYWMHAGFLMINDEKMSKSFEGFITLRDFLKQYSANAFRYLVMTHHYRSPINYSPEIAGGAEEGVETLKEFLIKLQLISKKGKGKEMTAEKDLETMEKDFISYMEDDLNTSAGISSIFTFVNKYQKNIWNMNRETAKLAHKKILEILMMLGFTFPKEKEPTEIKKMLVRRDEARGNKDFKSSDALRKKIEELGYKVEDTPMGQLVMKK